MTENFEKFAKEVNQLLSDVDKRREIGEKGFRVARSRFSWDSITNDLEGYFKKVIKKALR
jgi:glycosyltransferase involved in cell wall biosynthesis